MFANRCQCLPWCPLRDGVSSDRNMSLWISVRHGDLWDWHSDSALYGGKPLTDATGNRLPLPARFLSVRIECWNYWKGNVDLSGVSESLIGTVTRFPFFDKGDLKFLFLVLRFQIWFEIKGVGIYTWYEGRYHGKCVSPLHVHQIIIQTALRLSP